MSRMSRLGNITAAAAVCLLLVYGCSRYSQVPDTDPFMDKWKAKAQESQNYYPAPAQASPDLANGPVTPPVGIKPEQEKERLLPTKPVSISMNKVDVSVLLRALARAADVNIILNNKVTGRADLNITQAPWNQVFMGILRSHNLTYSWQGDIIRIMTSEDLEEELRKEVRRRDLSISEPMVSRIVPIKFAAADKLQENMRSFLSVDKTGKPVGSILVDQHTNSLIINAVPRDLNAILAVIEKLDKPTPQVHIEAFIVEATKDVARDLGVQWGGAYQVSGGDKRGFLTGRDNNALGQGVGTAVSPNTGTVVDNPVTDLAATSLGLIYQNVGKALLSVQLTALQNDGKVNILSTPSITTLDNQMALIESGQDVPYQSVSDGQVNIQYKKAVLSLKVTPHVIDNHTLKLGVIVKKDEVDFSQATRVLGNPTINTKNAETNVIQADGQTLVIGGLNKETTSDTQAGTPSLMDVPGLGWLFKRDGKSSGKEDLLIFITPTILKVKESGATGG